MRKRTGEHLAGQIRAFDTFAELAEKTVPLLRSGSIALSGGTTFSALYPRWRALAPDCSAATFFPVDERMVPFDDAQSNWGAAYREFLAPVGRMLDKKHHVRSVPQYTAMLRRHFSVLPPIFDTIFLGAGTDGHTASLFPGEPYLADITSIVLRTRSPEPPRDRITLGPVVLTSARILVAIIAGKGKEGVVAAIRRGDRSAPIVDILSRHPAPRIWVQRDILR
jgi:6-phosphogluconolactonase